MRTLLLLACVLASPALAQDKGTPPAAGTTCTDVQVGTAQGYDCLNAQLSAIARAQPRPSASDAPVTATSPGYQTGAANQAATEETLAAMRARRAGTPPPPPPVTVRPR